MKQTVKYLRIQTKKNLIWKEQINHVAIKLNKVNNMLSKKHFGLSLHSNV